MNACEYGPMRCLTVKEVEVGRIFSTQGRYDDCIHNFSRKPGGKRPLARPVRRILKELTGFM
jgi:hypothetical protein